MPLSITQSIVLKVKNEISTFLAKTNVRLGLAVSGGADSTALLKVISLIINNKILNDECKKKSLYVISVNHQIRPKEECLNDINFVKNLCETLSTKDCPIFFECKSLMEGEVAALAKKRGRGTEDAARILRYEKFNEFVCEKELDALLLAHTKNDNAETILMHFLQGGIGEIQKANPPYFRPLLDISRNEIEHFLKENNLTWQEDSTNSDTNYLRNKIRHKLIPLLNDDFPGWQKAIISGNKKRELDSKALNLIASNIKWTKNKNGYSIPYNLFFAQEKAVQFRVLYKLFTMFKITERVPFLFVESVCNKPDDSHILYSRAGDIQISKQNNELCAEKINNFDAEKRSTKLSTRIKKQATDFGFSVIISECGKYSLPFGNVMVGMIEEQNRKIINITVENIKNENTKKSSLNFFASFPICIRSKQIGDKIQTKNGSEKSLSDIFSNWKVTEDLRRKIPIVQEVKSQRIVCILGSVYNYDDWIVL